MHTAIGGHYRYRLLPGSFLKDADCHAARGRRKLQVHEIENGFVLVVKILDAPPVGVPGRGREHRQCSAQQTEGGGIHSESYCFIGTGPEESTSSTWLADSMAVGAIRASTR